MASPALAPPQVVDVTLALFGGRKTDIAPSDCPEGITPDEQDGVYLPGDWQSRPCLSRLFASGQFPPNPQVLYEKTYIQPNNDPLTLFLTSDGQFWMEDVGNNPDDPSSIFQISPGLYAQSVTADGREYIAFSDLLHGQAVPLQYDGTNLDRVTQDGPGQSPTVADYSLSTAITNIHVDSTNGCTATEAATVVTATTGTPHGFLAGELVFVQGMTPAGYNGLQAILTVPSATTFTYQVVASGLGAGSGGNVGPAVGDVVTAVANNLNVGDAFTVSGTASGFDNSAVGNPAFWMVLQVLGPTQVRFSFAASTVNTYTTQTTGELSTGGQSSPGYHQVVCLFLTLNGALAQPSPPLPFVSIGNTQWQISNIPIGPANVVARVLGFTGAGGDNFFIIPASITLPNP